MSPKSRGSDTPAAFVVGIDLGTTNCALSYAPRTDESRDSHLPEVLPVFQRGKAGLGETLPVLPSFLYLPHESEVRDDGYSGGPVPGAWIGAYARDHGERVPGRLVRSAKSWLTVAGIAREECILPWEGEPGRPRISPVQASAAYLAYLRTCWDKHWEDSGDPHPLADQVVVLTVPASFDATARDLTVRAAHDAGLPHVVLLEEPQAAFYAWLAANRRTWRTRLRNRRLILVCDVGGGTTDFSLIRIVRENGVLVPQRVAIGDHLLAGGDNIDIALAHHAEARLAVGTPLDALRFTGLTAACRRAKETLLAEGGASSVPVTVLGAGSSVVANVLETELTRDEVAEIILNRFFPRCTPESAEPQTRRSGLIELGLPYAQDPAVTRNLARFLAGHVGEKALQANVGTEALPRPDAVLFNGGTLLPSLIRHRILEVLESWFGSDQGGTRNPIVDLGCPNLELAVAQGAAIYGRARQGNGIRIGGGSGRSYYIGCQGGDAVCVLPEGAREGETFSVQEPLFELVTGRPVQFSLFESHTRPQDELGCLVARAADRLNPLPPLQTSLASGRSAKTTTVMLEAGLTEVGTLQVVCEAKQGDDRHLLTFELRNRTNPASSPAPRVDKAVALSAATLIQAAGDIVGAIFSRKRKHCPGSREDPRHIRRSLERAMERAREEWSVGDCRSLFDVLRPFASQRKQTALHEVAWFNVAGFCLRPGFGGSKDGWRIEQVLPLLDEWPQAQADADVRLAWWVFWRRVAGGLSAAKQGTLVDAIAPHVCPGSRHFEKGGHLSIRERVEIWRMAASLERVDHEKKNALGTALLDDLNTRKNRDVVLWALGRIGSRIPFAGSLHQVLPSEMVLPWVEAVLKTRWHETPAGFLCLIRMARYTGDRTLDLPETLRIRIRSVLSEHGMATDQTRPLVDVVPCDRDESTRVFGESLPEGLRIC